MTKDIILVEIVLLNKKQKMKNVIKYMKHLPTCNIMQNWSEADQAMADTPQSFRDADYYRAVEEIEYKKHKCTCGYEEAVKALKAGKTGISISLPSDEEIKREYKKLGKILGKLFDEKGMVCTFAGAQWMRNYIAEKINDLSAPQVELHLHSDFASDKIKAAMEYAYKCHTDVNQFYDGKPYIVHPQMVYDYGCKYAHLLSYYYTEYEIGVVLCACWTHDLIDDCRKTYADIRDDLARSTGRSISLLESTAIADITFALSNEKGKLRRDRENEKYLSAIADSPLATFAKLCDRLANVKYSKENEGGDHKLEMYKKGYGFFKEKLFKIAFKEMFNELDELLK